MSVASDRLLPATIGAASIVLLELVLLSDSDLCKLVMLARGRYRPCRREKELGKLDPLCKWLKVRFQHGEPWNGDSSLRNDKLTAPGRRNVFIGLNENDEKN